jgi:hypothetical protein
MKMKQAEFFGLNNFRTVKKCCRTCKHIRNKVYNYKSLNGDTHVGAYFYCNHPDIEQPETPGPVAEFDICDAFELAELES